MATLSTIKDCLAKIWACAGFSRFLRDRNGAVMIYVAAILPVLVGGGLLAVDGARLFNLQTLLQKGADSLALAAAKELDGRPDAFTRANLALANLVDNQHTFSAGGLTNIAMGDITPRFLSGIPADDNDPIDGSYDTADPTEARFVEVTINPVNLNTIFPISFFTSTGTVISQATAVAGFNLVACEFTPVFICNPFEGTGESILDVVNDPAKRRRLINLKKHGGGGSQYSPGNYGFLQPLQNPGANELRDMIAMSTPPACFLQNGVTLRPGFVATVRDAMNVRFDLYDGPMNSKKNDPEFRPARNVRKGYEGPACNPSPDEDEPPENQKLPRDNCFAGGTCPHMGGRMGDGEWDFDEYWDVSFGHAGAPPATDSDGAPYQCGASGDPCANPPSRYDIYRYEIENGLVGNPSLGGEVGAPQCSTTPTSDDPDRRMLYGAVLNCQELGIDGGSSGPYPVEAFAKFFVTEPMQVGPDDNIFVEMVGVFDPGGGGGVVRDDVQLYR